MRVRCEYCNNLIDDGDEKCPGCGAVNKNYNRASKDIPTTIEELAKWYQDRGLPPYEKTRFFIGEDYKEPKAFGIYKDENTGKYVVYKNKDTGERAIRYEGTDEKYAVNELYLKLKEEIWIRKNSKIPKPTFIRDFICIVIFVIVSMLLFLYFCLRPSDGYYNFNGNEYYHHSGSWYIYSNNRWQSTAKPSYDDDISTILS